MVNQSTIPLFPLGIVLFPGGKHDLQIFERRYIDMVTECMRNQTIFGICALQTGPEMRESGTKQMIHRIGTGAEIVDWNQLDNGLLSITVEGTAKFLVEKCWEADNDLLMGLVNFHDRDRFDTELVPGVEKYSRLIEVLRGLEAHPVIKEKNFDIDYADLWHLGWRLGELLPMSNVNRQKLLEIDDPVRRADAIDMMIAELAGEK
jgi:Lon protease-like protein